MTRQEILSQYTVENGVIRTLGKFESEPLYAPYFWDMGLDGAWSEDVANVYFFIISPEDRAEFPELGQVYGVAISESETGFVYADLLETESQYAMAVQYCECSEAEAWEESEDEVID